MARILYLVRHGQTFFNKEERLGGDSELTSIGIQHAEKLAESLKDIPFHKIYCSTLKRSIQTAEIISRFHQNTPLISLPALHEVSSGDMDSLTYDEFNTKFPHLFTERQKDKYHWAFPNGESYGDALKRVKNIIDSLEQIILIVGHQAINRTIIGYILSIPSSKIPYLTIPHEDIYVIDLDTKKCTFLRQGKMQGSYQFDLSIKADV